MRSGSNPRSFRRGGRGGRKETRGCQSEACRALRELPRTSGFGAQRATPGTASLLPGFTRPSLPAAVALASGKKNLRSQNGVHLSTFGGGPLKNPNVYGHETGASGQVDPILPFVEKKEVLKEGSDLPPRPPLVRDCFHLSCSTQPERRRAEGSAAR